MVLFGEISNNNILKPFPWDSVLATALNIGGNLSGNNYDDGNNYEFKPSNYYYDDDFTHKYINGNYRDLNSKILETQNYQYQKPKYTNPITDTQQQAIFKLDRDSFFEKFRKGLALEAQKLTRRLPDPIHNYYFGQINNEYLNNSNNIPNGPILHYVSQHHPTPHKQKIYDYYTRPYSLRTPKDSELFQYALQLSNHLDNSDKYANAGYNYIKNLSAAANPRYWQGFSSLNELAHRAAEIKRQQAGGLNLPDLSGFAAQNQNSEPMAEFKRLYEYYLDTQKKKIQAQNQLNQLVAQKSKPDLRGQDQKKNNSASGQSNAATTENSLGSKAQTDTSSKRINELIQNYKRQERGGVILKNADKIILEGNKNDVSPIMVAGVLLNETPRPFYIDNIFEEASKVRFYADKSVTKYPTVGIAQVSPISALVELELGFFPIGVDSKRLINSFKPKYEKVSQEIIKKMTLNPSSTVMNSHNKRLIIKEVLNELRKSIIADTKKESTQRLYRDYEVKSIERSIDKFSINVEKPQSSEFLSEVINNIDHNKLAKQALHFSDDNNFFRIDFSKFFLKSINDLSNNHNQLIKDVLMQVLLYTELDFYSIKSIKSELTKKYTDRTPEMQKARDELERKLRDDNYSIWYTAKIIRKLKDIKHPNKKILTDKEMAEVVGLYNDNPPLFKGGKKYGESFYDDIDFLSKLLLVSPFFNAFKTKN